MKLKLLEFILNNANWKELLQSDPFNITIKEDDRYMLFSYNMISSDFSNPIVQECRGLILRKLDFAPVCVPFFKFFNVQEGHAAVIDWSTAKVQSKIDGSIIKVWYDDNEWHISTNGTIDAQNAELQVKVADIQTYYDLFVSADNMHPFFFDMLDRNHTYMFELTSPFNRVVVPYKDTRIWHIGTRDNTTLKELDLHIGIQKPEEHALSTLDECLEIVKVLPFDVEGYVVRDAKYNRVKIKSVAYVAAHHLKNNGAITPNRILDLIRANGQDDFLAVYPEFTSLVDSVLGALSWFSEVVNNDWNAMPDFSNADRKTYAMWAKNQHCPSFFFELLKDENLSLTDWLFAQTNERILKMIGIAG